MNYLTCYLFSLNTILKNCYRHLLVRCFTKRRAREWSEILMETAKTTARDFTQINRYESFAPVRNNNECRWYVWLYFTSTKLNSINLSTFPVWKLILCFILSLLLCSYAFKFLFLFCLDKTHSYPQTILRMLTDFDCMKI